jgi:hypothetical protein
MMPPGARVTYRRTWLRALRWIVAALVLALVPAPATAVRPLTDTVVLVATRGAADESRARASRPAHADFRSPASTYPRTDATALLPSRTAGISLLAQRERLYLLDCALLR